MEHPDRAERDPYLPVDYSDDGVDLTLIRWMLSLTPGERLQYLENHVNDVLAIRGLNAEKLNAGT